MPNQISLLKSKLRNEIEKKRNLLSQKEIIKNSAIIKKRLFATNEFKLAKNIMFYVSFRSEVVTYDMIKESLQKGKRIFVPITKLEEKKLIISEIKDFDKELEVSTYRILEPKIKFQRVCDANLLDLIIVPGVAFDLKGNRLGYGGGYYDKFLKNMPSNIPRIGLCFKCQIIKEIPVDIQDERINILITEKGKIK
ncbi:MAG: 5-formyltetrahydrofolate cyclo-ligase [Candidatus Firestonebacteria bacterium]